MLVYPTGHRQPTSLPLEIRGAGGVSRARVTVIGIPVAEMLEEIVHGKAGDTVNTFSAMVASDVVAAA